MRPTGTFNIMNFRPEIQISNYDLEAIRHIVDIAPQEAQWYHTVQKKQNGNKIVYEIAGMYVPEQYTSAASVETDPNMMVSFFKELRDKHGVEKTNEIISTMTCWCHSHHNMAAFPSGQDHKQFTEQCENAIKDKVTVPQIMLIFNKKDEYYCRVYDPEIGMIFENVDMVETPYDFSWINKEAKSKFKKKTYKKSFSSKTSKYKKQDKFLYWDTFLEQDKDASYNYGYNLHNKTGAKKFKSIYKHLKIPKPLQKSITALKCGNSTNTSSLLAKIQNCMTAKEMDALLYLLMVLTDPVIEAPDLVFQQDNTTFDLDKTLIDIENKLALVEYGEFESAVLVACNLSDLDLIAMLEDFQSIVVESNHHETSRY